MRTHSHVLHLCVMKCTQGIEGINNVHLIGKLGQHVFTKEMPSGDQITTFTVIVPRTTKPRIGKQMVDSLACQTRKATIRSKVESWPVGTWVEIHGELRRRFWQSGKGLGSATEIEVRTLFRVRESTGVKP